MAAAAAFAAVLGISAFWGQHDRAYDQAGTAGSAYGRMYNQAGPADEDGGPAGKAGAYPGPAGAAQAAEGAGEDLARTGGEDAEILPDVTESQKAVLDKIVKALEAQDLETAAQVMDSGEEELVTLFYEVMDGARYLYDGVVVDTGLQAGDRIQDGRQLRLAVGGLEMKAQIDRETAGAGLLKKGSMMQVKLAGQSKNVETEVEDLNHLAEDGKIQVTAGMPEGQGRLGDLVSFTANIESGIYPCVIPIEALREDNEGYYCLAAEPEKTILGEELKAVRIQVDVLEKSSSAAAVSGPVTKEMKLITESGKPVSEGDRVRVVEE